MEPSHEVSAREFNQQASRILARVEAGETITVTKNGVPIGDFVPRGSRFGEPDYPFPTDPMGEDPSWEEPPEFSFDPMSQDEQEALLAEGFGRE